MTQKWISTLVQKPANRQLVICRIGFGELHPYSVKVAEYDKKEDCFVFGEADGNFKEGYVFCGFIRSEAVTGWIPFPEIETRGVF